MKKIIQFAVNYPVTITMIVLAVLLLGKISYDRLSVDLLPDLNSPKLYIELKAGERPPEEIENQFVKSMEAAAIRQSDVTRVSSVTKAGSARITVEYSWNKDMDEAFLDMQKAMNTFSRSTDITELKITQHNPNSAPVMLIGITHKEIRDMAELRKIVDSYIRNELIRLEGVAEVALSGDEVTHVIIDTDPYRLDAFGLSQSDIATRIESNNQSISGGQVTELGMQYLVKSSSMFSDLPDFEKLIVGYKPVTATTDNGSQSAESAPIFLREVATVRFENAEPENIVRINGERSIGLSVYKEMQSNTMKTVENVTKQLKSIEQALPGYKFQVISNQGTFIRAAIGEVQESALLGIILAVVVLYIFLRRVGTTLVISLAIPISIVATFNLMFFNNISLNIMSLGGLALGAGMLIDNAVVVIENIFRCNQADPNARNAAVRGTAEVSGAVTASTLTTIVVFLPIVYLHGASGELFKDQAWTVTFSLLSSLLVALFVIPMLYVLVYGKRARKEVSMAGNRAIEIKGYGDFLLKLLGKRWMVVLASVVILAGAICLLPLIGSEFMPKSDGNSFSISVKLPEGSRLERTVAVVESLENMLHEIVQDSTILIYSHAGEGSNSANAIFEGENTATITVLLPPGSKIRPEYVMEKLSWLSEESDELELSFKQEENTMASVLGDDEAPIIVEVKGEELEDLLEIASQVKEKMEDIPGLYNVISSMEKGAPELIISVNRMVAGINNISVSTIIQQVGQQLEGYDAGKLEYKGEMRDIRIKVPRISLDGINSLIIKSGQQEFQLQEIATITHSETPREIFRRNQSRISKVLANYDNSYSLDRIAQQIRTEVSSIELPDNYTITVTGEEEKREESMKSLLFALLLSVVLVYMVLASQFESLLHPFTILLTIPLSLVGSILLFYITGTTLNMMGFIGIIMLAGISINNSIILVDRISQIKLSGTPLNEAIAQAGQQRIRPILITSFTTILALIPMSLSFGEGASLRSPMAIAVIGGLFSSILMSLVVIPCVYYLFEELKSKTAKPKAG